MENNKKIIKKIKLVLPHLNEAQKRIYLASEALYSAYKKTPYFSDSIYTQQG